MLGSRSSYIGDIDSDDFDSVKFKIRFNNDARDRVNIPVTIIYKDSVNKNYIEGFEILVDVYDRDEAIKLGLIQKNNFGLYFGIIVGLIIVYFGYKKFRKWKNAKKS
ncbi:hypothetical protein HOD75_04180 [archaeon]|nr:hypothetical protein [archaeon]MBT4242065.1 hypothetical protein [archaeon]MBT4417753.1 hypothetical protein [archaeon]